MNSSPSFALEWGSTIGPLGRKDGAEFECDSAQAPAEIEIREKRRTPEFEATIKGLGAATLSRTGAT